MKEKGQIVIILLLAILVALSIGLAIVQNSTTDLSLSTKIEQSSRAFSAAEAGIEQALFSLTSQIIPFSNQSQADVNVTASLPDDTAAGHKGIEYPPISKSEIAHFWLAYPGLPQSPIGQVPATKYNKNNVNIFWGNCNNTTCPDDPNDKPAIEVTAVVRNTGNNTYEYVRGWYDPDSARITATNNGFSSPTCSITGTTTNTIIQDNSIFYCSVTFQVKSLASQIPMLLRVRLLYTNSSHKVAINSVDTPPGSTSAGRFPAQVNLITSKGTAGDTQRKLKALQMIKVPPLLLDYGIFSVGKICKGSC